MGCRKTGAGKPDRATYDCSDAAHRRHEAAKAFAQNYAKKRCKRRLETKPRFHALAGSCGCSDSIVLPCAFTLMPWAASSPIGQNGFTKMRRVAKTRHVATRE